MRVGFLYFCFFRRTGGGLGLGLCFRKRKDGGGGLIGDGSVIDRWTECIFLKVSV